MRDYQKILLSLPAEITFIRFFYEEKITTILVRNSLCSVFICYW